MDTYLAEGINIGALQKAKQIAINAIKEGFNDETIQKLTNLPIENIIEIRKNL